MVKYYAFEDSQGYNLGVKSTSLKLARKKAHKEANKLGIKIKKFKFEYG